MKKTALIIIIIFLVLSTLYFLRPQNKEDKLLQELTPISMKISSTAFGNNEKIPSKYTCDGENISPPLQFSEVPENAQSLVLISDDPDAPAGTWVHWTVWDIDPKTTEITENTVPEGGIEGTTSFGNTGYGSPCPPSGTHRYFFKLYALNTKLSLLPSATIADVESSIKNNILAEAEIIGLYRRE